PTHLRPPPALPDALPICRLRGLLQRLQRNELRRLERIDLRTAEIGNVAEAAEVATHVTRERTHIGALAALDLQHGLVRFRNGNRSEEHTSELQSRENLVC